MKGVNKNLVRLLDKSSFARNCTSPELEKLYILEFLCENQLERNIVNLVLSRKRPGGASLKRERAYIQNTKGLYLSSAKIKALREKQEQEVREQYSPINGLIDGFKKYFNF